MTDRELLELAAKAAGIEIKVVIGDTFWCPDGTMWDPLTNDADALRLAVTCDIAFMLETERASATTNNGLRCTEWLGDDPFAATRRAIVRAAAEIGRQHEHQ